MVGEVDHGKSSLVGRLLDETGAISPSRVEAVKRICQQQGKEFEHAFLLDAFEEEQRQGITIDVSHVHFATKVRSYHLIDAPGHREFLKNMVSGSSSADAAILLIDAKQGVQEQSRRHSYLLKMLGIKNVIVAVNKMDLVGYSEMVFTAIRFEHETYLKELGITQVQYVPLSAKVGVNISNTSNEMPWYKGTHLVGCLDTLPSRKLHDEGPLRFSVQDVYKFDDRRIVAGRVESGRLNVGAELKIWPAGKNVKVTTIERWNSLKKDFAEAGESIGITLSDQVFIERGHVLTLNQEPVSSASAIETSLFWMGQRPLCLHDHVKIKLLNQEMTCEVSRIHRIIDTTSLQGSTSDIHRVEKFEVAEVTLKMSRPLMADTFAQLPTSGRFVLVDSNKVSGGGIITKTFDTDLEHDRPKNLHITRELSNVATSDRNARNGHQGAVLWLTGLSGSGKSTLAKVLESALFDRGHQTYVLDGDNLRHGLNSDLDFSIAGRRENIRRVAEVAKILSEAGQIVIAAFITPFERDRANLRRIVNSPNYFEAFVDCPLEVCEARDPKGLYKLARTGQLPLFTGVSSPFEKPTRPEIIIDSNKISPEDNMRVLLRFLESKNVFVNSAPKKHLRTLKSS